MEASGVPSSCGRISEVYQSFELVSHSEYDYIRGIKTNIGFLENVLRHPEFLSGQVHPTTSVSFARHIPNELHCILNVLQRICRLCLVVVQTHAYLLKGLATEIRAISNPACNVTGNHELH